MVPSFVDTAEGICGEALCLLKAAAKAFLSWLTFSGVGTFGSIFLMGTLLLNEERCRGAEDGVGGTDAGANVDDGDFGDAITDFGGDCNACC